MGRWWLRMGGGWGLCQIAIRVRRQEMPNCLGTVISERADEYMPTRMDEAGAVKNEGRDGMLVSLASYLRAKGWIEDVRWMLCSEADRMPTGQGSGT